MSEAPSEGTEISLPHRQLIVALPYSRDGEYVVINQDAIVVAHSPNRTLAFAASRENSGSVVVGPHVIAQMGADTRLGRGVGQKIRSDLIYKDDDTLGFIFEYPNVQKALQMGRYIIVKVGGSIIFETENAEDAFAKYEEHVANGDECAILFPSADL